ncbi:sigma-54 interaction domain-containing protein [Vreelandella sp. EE22]
MHHELLSILNALEDGIFISDLDGRPLWVNRASLSQLDCTEERLYASTVYELEEQGVFSPSVTRFVIEERRSVSVVHRYRGKDFLVNGRLFTLGDTSSSQAPNAVVVQTRNLDEEVLASRSPDTTQALLDHVMHQLKRIRHEQVMHEDKKDPISSSPVYRRCLEFVERAAGSEATVLFTGETGVGKSFLVNRLHQHSARHDKPLIHVNCAAIPETLLEAELFGHVRGAFTGANRDGRVGHVALAQGGTLFLDEIGELPLALQPKLLQLLQEKTYHPLGGKPTQADVRIVAATNTDLEKRVAASEFRADLFYRLNIVPIHVPALRERREDILPLARHLLGAISARHKRTLRLEHDALRVLARHDWPGNVRELENLLERASVFCSNESISAADIDLNVIARPAPSVALEHDIDGTRYKTLPERMEAIERNVITQALDNQGSTRKAAESLGVTQSWLMRRLKRYRIEKAVTGKR